MATKEYSCVKKTKKAFENALTELSKEYPFNKITVKLLCEKAELSRNAFYFHYKDINDLIEDRKRKNHFRLYLDILENNCKNEGSKVAKDIFEFVDKTKTLPKKFNGFQDKTLTGPENCTKGHFSIINYAKQNIT